MIGRNAWTMDQQMTTGEMYGYQKRLIDILNGNNTNRDVRLAHLMTDLERTFHIPMMHKAAFNEANPHLMELYKTVSEERSL
ncbi:hypothetical protein [Salimicrobium halophilum]|uniref:Uncharacterized protein n=1 Tax=Salimicrobium halophilum TaxID=86666 RepID=A0A1G8WFJ5_9BACI|nr:hypothetical protein [Salimicrobium halophilum]SDJ76933.1 hypothetical protein SAMN04490247_3171 [Salimicrobium halophilum]